jgi:hypothetical protein
LRHTENCKKCKLTILNALKKEFGEVIDQWQSDWSCRIEDVVSLPEIKKTAAHALEKIYSTLQINRGHRSFVRRRKLQPCDYYIKSLNCIVEFDESQHFTAPRGLSLSFYPKTAQLAFNKEEWQNRCKTLNRHDNNPPDRDEQRAWYDALRDLLPAYFGMNPTIRIFAKEMVWCANETKTDKIIRESMRGYRMKNTTKRKLRKKNDLSLVKREHIRQAIAIVDKDGYPPGRGAKSTCLIFNRKYYPAKYVLGEAYRIATNKTLLPDDYHGGDWTAKIVSGLGFPIIKNGKSWKLAQSNGHKKLFRIFLKGNYDREEQEHNGSGFKKWVIKNGKMSEERMGAIFDKLFEIKGSHYKSVILFPASTLVIKSEKSLKRWKSFLQKMSRGSTIIMGVIDLTRSETSQEFTAVYSNGRYIELDASEPQRKLPCGNGWAYISSNINNHEYKKDPGKFCFDLGHGAYTGRYKGTLRKISRLKNVIIILTAWYKSPPSVSWIIQKGEELPTKMKPFCTEHMDLIEQIKYPFVKNIFH